MDDLHAYGPPILNNLDCVIYTNGYLLTGPIADVATLHDTLGGTAAPSSGQGYYTYEFEYNRVVWPR